MKWVVRSSQKLAPFLRDQLGHSGKQIRKALEANLCRVNGKPERFGSASLKSGDAVEMAEVWNRPASNSKPEVLYEDEWLLVLNKSAGVVCHPKSFPKWHLVHRLDKDTTGALLLAKSAQLRDQLFALFEDRTVEKKYLAVVDGIPREEEGTRHSKLAPKRSFQGQTIWGSGPSGQTAITHWKRLQTGKQSALILCEPYTGRTHQIRVHLAEMGHPILVDRQYASTFRCRQFIQRPLLHAASLKFAHPVTGQTLSIEAPLPVDICEALRNLSMSHPGDGFGKQKQENSGNQRQEDKQAEKAR